MAKTSETKVYQIDIKLDTERIAEGLLLKPVSEEERFSFARQIQKWQATPEDKRGKRPELKQEKLTGPEFFKDIVMKAIQMSHKTGNTASLRRTRAIEDQINIAMSKKDGVLELIEDDYIYIKSAIAKAEDWTNIPEVARGVLLVEDTLLGAKVL